MIIFPISLLDFSLSGDHNSVWFFEKESSRMQDQTPVYEGTITEYQHTVKVSRSYSFFSKERITASDPVPSIDDY